MDTTKQSAKKSDKSNKSKTVVQPTEFQKEIMAMSFESFVNETNIRDLVVRDFNRQFKGTKQITENNIQYALRLYDRFRKKPKIWVNNSLVDLKYKICDCKRNKQFVDESIQTEDNSMDFVTSRINQQEEQQELQVVEGLEICRIDETQLYRLVQISPTTADAEQETQVHLTENVIFTVLPSQIMNQSDVETHYSTSQSASGSTQAGSGSVQIANQSPQCTNSVADTTAQTQNIDTQLAESQRVISLAEVRMSELIESHPAEADHALARNPFETQTVPENTMNDVVSNAVHEQSTRDIGLPSPIIDQFDPQENSSPTTDVNTVGLEGSQNSAEVQDGGQVIKIKMESAPFERSPRADDDSEIECLGTQYEPIIEIKDDDDSEDSYMNCIEGKVANVIGESSNTLGTNSQENSMKIATQNELINILADSPVIEDSESSLVESPLRNIGNIQAAKERPSSKVTVPTKRAISVQAQKKATTKKRKVSHDDSLKNIQVPKYNYGPLEFHVKRRTDNEQPQPSNTEHDYTIEENSSAEELNVSDSNADHDNGIVSNSCVERANLLNQDNTLFLNVNTQLIYSGSGSTDELAQSLTMNAINEDATTSNSHKNNQPEGITTSIPSIPSILSSIKNDQTEFLHYVDITKITSKFTRIISDLGKPSHQLEIETTLQHQCNANNRIVIKANALKSVMKLTDKEWNAVLFVLSKAETFHYESKSWEPINASILHRTLYYLFKTASKISNVHITYGDHDLETARVIHKSYISNENITPAISQFVLSKMKETIQQQNQQI